MTLLAGTPFEEECEEPFYVVMTHHTANANLEKGSSWPPEAMPQILPGHGSGPCQCPSPSHTSCINPL